MSIESDELIEVLKHWKKARETRLNETEIAENLRCAVDIVGLLGEHGYFVHADLWKAGSKKAKSNV